MLTVILSIVTLGLIVPTYGLSCPDSYVMGPCDTCYKFEHAKTTWHKAQGICMQDGGALVSVNSEPKAAALAGIMALRGLSRADDTWWIGLFADQKAVNNWQWITPENSTFKMTYGRWVPGEPNNYHGVEESCVETYGARNLTWNDAPCTGLKKYICELIPESVMDTVVVG